MTVPLRSKRSTRNREARGGRAGNMGCVAKYLRLPPHMTIRIVPACVSFCFLVCFVCVITFSGHLVLDLSV